MHINTTKASTLEYFDGIRTSYSNAISSASELDSLLEKVDEMEDRYQSYLKTHFFVSRFFINLCWWNTSVRGTYINSLNYLAGRVAEGYEDKMVSLLTCKHFLTSPTHQALCKKAIEISIANTSTNEASKGYVWKVVNDKGVTNYLIGTVHAGTKNMVDVEGIQEALSHSEIYFTEKGLPLSLWKGSHFPLFTRDLRFSFILDRHIALVASSKNKQIFSLDNKVLEKETEEKIKSVRKAHTKSTINLGNELPSAKFFQDSIVDFALNIPLRTKYLKEEKHLDCIQTINSWKKGTSLDRFCTEALYTLCDERTKAWLNHSFKSFRSTNPTPGLIEQIRETTKPICIAVGVSHCTGSRISLVTEFRNAGFRVTRI